MTGSSVRVIQPGMDQPSGGRRARLLVVGIVALIALRVALLALVFAANPHGLPRVFSADALRYRQIAEETGRPYRDFDVEFPPVSLAVIDAVAGSSERGTEARLGVLELGLDLVIAGALALGWGAGAALAYLALGLPLVPFVYFRLDLLSVALATLGMLAVARRMERAGGLALAAASLAKVWPIALVPVLYAAGRRRSSRWAVGGLVAGCAAWLWIGGTGGFRQVATFRGAKGWQIESLVGSVIRLVSNPGVALEAGADRVGSAGIWARSALLLAAVGLIAVVAWLTRRLPDLAHSVSSATAVACLMIASPILSPQYLTWLLPWVAIGVARGERIQAELLGAAMLLSVFLVYDYGRLVAGAAPLLAMALVRALLLAGLVAVGLVRLTGRRLEAPPVRTGYRRSSSGS